MYHGKNDEVIPEMEASKNYERLFLKSGFKNVEYYIEDNLGHFAGPNN